MKATSIFLLAFFLVLLVNGSSAADKTNFSASSGLDPNLIGSRSSNDTTGGSNLVTNSSQTKNVNGNRGDQVNKSVKGADDKNGINKNNTFHPLGSKNAENVQKGNSVPKGQKELSDRKDNLSDEVKSKDASKEGDPDEDSGKSRKEGTRVEECHSSNKCMDEKMQFVACLRVPGNDSPDLSLLIQNKVKGPLTVRISAPDYVRLEKTKVQLRENEGNELNLASNPINKFRHHSLKLLNRKHVRYRDDQLRVSIRRKGTVNLITIKAGNGNCRLDFKDLMAHNSGEDFDNSLKSTYFKFLSKKPTVPFISFAALLILASGCLCVSLRCKQLSSGKSKYQRLDMEVPVASLGNSESDNNHGWDNSWDDNWDDEEAPKTPSLPVTPSLSSKGLASRRLSKEGWKD
ncbi:hypothetical protein CUMW_043120 [Citrus unshiu]|nr:hypothetical protein CUMW_043120 [Citrus unshiu]